MTAPQLRELRQGYASVTRETRAVTRVTRNARAHVHERYTPYTYIPIKESDKYKVCANTKLTRNRVTRVTARVSRVTSRVTTSLTRNYKG